MELSADTCGVIAQISATLILATVFTDSIRLIRVAREFRIWMMFWGLLAAFVFTFGGFFVAFIGLVDGGLSGAMTVIAMGSVCFPAGIIVGTLSVDFFPSRKSKRERGDKETGESSPDR